MHQATRRDRTNVLYWMVILAGATIEWLFTYLLRNGVVYGWEIAVSRALQDDAAGKMAFRLTSPFTNTLSPTFIAPFLLLNLGLLALRLRREATLLLLTFPCHVLVQFPKALIDRPRPSAEFTGLEGVGGSQSFPSGHVEYAITFYGLLIYFILQRVPDRRLMWCLGIGHMLLVASIAYGRVAAGRHWPLDVLVSGAMGAALLAGFLWLNRSWLSAAAVNRPAERATMTGRGYVADER